jgi:septum formation topological specificity factor MinE
MIKPKWDREREFSEWIGEAIDAYLSELQGNHRMDFFNTVAATLCRVQTKYDTLERLKNRLELIDTGDADTRASLTRQATQLSNLPVEIFEFTSLERRLFGDCVHDINLTLFILEDGEFEVQMEQVDVNPASNASRGASRSLESIIAEVDNAAEDDSMQMDGLVGDAMHWVEEEVSAEEINKPKKKTKNQRRRQAKEKQTAELASILGELCAKVARETVVENERRAMEAAEEERRRAIAAEEETKRRAIAAEEEKKRLEMIAAEERETICAGLMDAVVGEIAEELAKELKAEMSLRSQKDVLEQAKMGVLPPGFVQELLVSEFPAVDNMLQPVVECFICMQPIDFRDPRVRFLVCCSGGSFSCPDCIAIHSPPDRHAIQAERQIVVLAASLRRRLKLGEFA